MYEYHSTAGDFLKRVRAHARPYDVNVRGVSLTVHPNVLSPAYDWSSTFIVDHLPDLKDRSVLDMGCGTGILGLFAALSGAKEVWAADINPAAVANTRENFEQYRFVGADFRVIESDLFEDVPSRQFDSILFNAPFHGVVPADMLERSIADENYETSVRFFDESTKYLSPTGTIYYAFGSMGNLSLIRREWERRGYRVQEFAEGERLSYRSDPGENWSCWLFALRRSVN